MHDAPRASRSAGAARTEFESVERALALFVRGLMGPGVRIDRAPRGAVRTFALGARWYFPATMAGRGARGRGAFFAAAAHLAAHARFGGPPFERRNLKALPIVLISLLEDARVERLLSRELSGLPILWRSLHTALPTDLPTFAGLSARLARALADPGYVDLHPLVTKARAFFESFGTEAPSREACRAFGSVLGNDLGQMRLPMDAKTYTVEPPYRDDHRLLWEPLVHAPHDPDDAVAMDWSSAAARESFDGGGSPRGGQLREARFQDATADVAAADVATANAEGPSMAIRYHEWDYQIRRARPAFCTVREVSCDAPGLAELSPSREVPRCNPLARAVKIGAPRRRGQLDGDAFDLDAVVEARVDLARGARTDGRVYVHTAARRPELAVLMLLDLSASTGDPIPGGALRVIDVTRAAASLVALSLQSAGHGVAVHGFSSNGRHDVVYRRIKDFGDPWDAKTDARLAAVSPGLSTRMGAALRHAARYLAPQRRDRRVLLLLTDGDPRDIDAPDPAYLAHDAARAVREILRQGIHVFAIDVDPAANARSRRVFGAGRFRVVDRIERLPEVLTALFARLAR
jgi:nitric oxide reductase NorD protein